MLVSLDTALSNDVTYVIYSCSKMDNSVLLRVAVIENKPNGVKLIMSRGLNVNNVLSKIGPASGYTALHWASTKNRLNIVKQLVQDYQADVNSVADDGLLKGS
ncbi:uncharacterized protein LOC141532155 [Cotesia typhae]|uniref:uncharacterized protein LOC141532155 n=1 Tax=Cotesia typhae TaxID=2053667 RepID=UPI003D6969CB